jgi:hypothetical protein
LRCFVVSEVGALVEHHFLSEIRDSVERSFGSCAKGLEGKGRITYAITCAPTAISTIKMASGVISHILMNVGGEDLSEFAEAHRGSYSQIAGQGKQSF